MFRRPDSKPGRGGVPSSCHSPHRRGGPISKHASCLQKKKIWAWFPVGTEAKIDCDVEGEQQFTRPTD
jgi:hypothetical protein